MHTFIYKQEDLNMLKNDKFLRVKCKCFCGEKYFSHLIKFSSSDESMFGKEQKKSKYNFLSSSWQRKSGQKLQLRIEFGPPINSDIF